MGTFGTQIDWKLPDCDVSLGVVRWIELTCRTLGACDTPVLQWRWIYVLLYPNKPF